MQKIVFNGVSLIYNNINIALNISFSSNSSTWLKVFDYRVCVKNTYISIPFLT